MAMRHQFGSILWLRTVQVLIALFMSSAAVAQSGLDLAGHAVNPLEGSAVTVLVFVRRDCPVSSRYAPVIEKISDEYSGRAKFWLVFPDQADSAAEMRKYLSDYRYSLPALSDPQRALVRAGRVQITPEVAVFREGRLIYDGRIDNWYVSLGKARAEPTTHELRDALDAALAGKIPAHAEVRGVGCYISDLE